MNKLRNTIVLFLFLLVCPMLSHSLVIAIETPCIEEESDTICVIWYGWFNGDGDFFKGLYREFDPDDPILFLDCPKLHRLIE